MNTRQELFKEYRLEIVRSTDVNLLRQRVSKARDLDEAKKPMKNKETKDDSLYAFYKKKRNVSIILYSFISIAILAIIAVGIYLGVNYLNGING